MKLIRSFALLFAALVSFAACSSGGATGTPGNGKVALKITFSDKNGKIVGKAGDKAVNSIVPLSSLKLTVTPATPSNYTPPPMDLVAEYNSGKQSVDITGLTDNETYTFRIMAYDTSSNLVYLGETATAVLPTGSIVSVNCLTFSGSSATLLTEGKNLLATKDLVAAKDKLMMSANSNLKNDEAKLYYSIARVLSMYDNVGSSNSTQMDSIKKLLDASGISYFSLNTLAGATTPPQMTLPKQLPASTPRAGQVRDYIRYYLLPEIDGAITNLSEISSSFSTTFSPAAYKLQGNDIVIDYADIMVLKTLLYEAKANVALATAYNFDFSIVDTINKNIPDLNFYNKQTQGSLFDATALLQNNKNIGTVAEAAMLTTAKAAYDSFVSNYESAFNQVKSRSSQSQNLFVLDVALPNRASFDMKSQNLTNSLAGIKQIQKALNGQTTLTPKIVPPTGSMVYNFDTVNMKSYSAIRPDTNNIINLSKFFNAAQPVNLRTAFVNCTTRTLFDLTQDKTLGGIYPAGYTASPIYNKGAGWINHNGGGWDIDAYVLSPNKIDVVNGLCN